MEKHFLDDFMRKELGKDAKLGLHKDDVRPWYNSHGDCIEFQTKHEAFVADRIDKYLTIYRSIDLKEPIGFQIKDVKALVKEYGAHTLRLKAEISGTTLISVRMLLLAAYESSPVSIARRQGYASASEAFATTQTQNIIDQVAIGQ